MSLGYPQPLYLLPFGTDEQQVARWLTVVAAVPGFIGFAVGRTAFWDALTGVGRDLRPGADAVIGGS